MKYNIEITIGDIVDLATIHGNIDGLILGFDITKEINEDGIVEVLKKMAEKLEKVRENISNQTNP